MSMESKNLIVRETVFDDCTYFAQWEIRPEVTEFFTMNEDRTYEQIVTEYVRYNLDPSKLQFTITLKPEDKPIGKIYLSRINRFSGHYSDLHRRSVQPGQGIRRGSAAPDSGICVYQSAHGAGNHRSL